MNPKHIKFLPIYFSMTLIFGMIIGYRISKNIKSVSEFFIPKNFNRFEEISTLIATKYVDTVNLESISDQKISEIVNSLDPHSHYLVPEIAEEVNEEIEGKFEGIGIEFNYYKDTPIVLRVLADGPAQKAGLHVGDKLILADTHILIHNKEIRKHFKGVHGSKVMITLMRKKEKIKLEVLRNTIPIKSVPIAVMINDTTGYIKIDKFISDTYKDFMIALENLTKQKCKHLILDLRDNGGGLLDAAVEIADEFLSDDKLIVYIEGKHFKKQEFKSRRKGIFEKQKLSVLVNENSASASEVLAGALQDWDRAKIVGKKSFGKGLVQEQFQLKNKAALRLTVAKYYTPSGRCIQKKFHTSKYGISIYDTTKITNQALTTSDTFRTSQGKIVFGENGICPDTLIVEARTMDTSHHDFNTKIYLDIAAHEIFFTRMYEALAYTNIKDFFKNFKISNNDYQIFKNLLSKDQALSDNFSPQKANTQLIKSIARIIFSHTEYFFSTMDDDAYINASL